MAYPAGPIAALRDAEWLTGARARAYGLLLAIGMAGVAIAWVLMSQGGLDPRGKPIGTDFAHYWTAGRLALDGRPAAAWDPTVLHAEQAATFGDGIAVTPFLYPPPFLLVCIVVALLPYGWSLVAWLSATGAAYWLALRRHIPSSVTGVPLVAFPAVFVNAMNGQNGFVTAALFAAAASLYQRWPAWAGVCLGLLSFKPHLGITVVVVLLAAQRWRVAIAATATVLSLWGASLLLLGVQSWLAFLEATTLARTILEQRLIDPEKLSSVFGAILLMGGEATLAYAVQAVVTLGVCALAWRIARRKPGGAGEVTLIAAATPLCSPYLFDYDLMILALPLAWVFARAQRDGFLAWEKAALLGAFLVPLLVRPVGAATGLALAPLAAAALLALVVRRLAIQRSPCPGL